MSEGNHNLYIARRKPESIELQQLKVAVNDEKQRKIEEQTFLNNEKQLRKEAERQKAILEKKVLQCREEIRLAAEALVSFIATIKSAIQYKSKLVSWYTNI